MKSRFLAVALVAATTLAAAPTLGQSQGWVLETATGAATLSHGKADTPSAFRLECGGGQSMFTTWTRNPPRNAGDGEFTTAIRIFQGRTEITYIGTGHPGLNGASRIDAPIRDAAALLDGARRNGRLVVVTHSGRSTAPAPAQADIDKFGLACTAAPQP